MMRGTELGDECTLQAPVAGNDERGATRDDAQRRLHAIELPNGSGCVAQQPKWKTILRREPAVGFDRIGTDSENLRAGCAKLFETVAEGADFFRAAGRVVFRIKEDHDLIRVAKVAEAHGITVLVGKFEIRRELAGDQDGMHVFRLQAGRDTRFSVADR